MKNKIFKSLLLFISLILFPSLYGQTYNADSLFVKVKKLAEKQEFAEAIYYTIQLKTDFPKDITYPLYLASLYNWNNQPNKSLTELNQLDKELENNREVIQLYVTTFRNLKQPEQVIEYSNKGIQFDNENEDFYKIAKAQAYIELDEKDQAIEILNSIPNSSNKYKDAQYLITEINSQKKNIIALGYLITTYNKPESESNHFVNVDYSRKLGKNTIITRLNYGNAFQKEGVLGEIDFYKKLSTSYFYFNAGASDGNFVFPQFKLGAEWFKETNKLSYSIGMRYLDFKDVNEVYLFTGHIGYKFKPNMLIGYRPYFVVNESKNSHTQTIFIKKTNEIKEYYWQIDLQYGTVPYYFLSNQIVSDLNSYRVGFNMKFKAAENLFLQPILLYEYQEYFPEEFRNVFNFQTIVSYRF